MIKYLKGILHWYYLTFFKPITLEEISESYSRIESVKIFLQVYIFGAIVTFLLLVLIGFISEYVGFDFDWYSAFSEYSKLFVGGLVGGLFGGLFGGLVGGLVVGLVVGLFVGLFGSLVVGLFGGLVGGLVGGLFVGLFVGLVGGLFVGLVFGLFFGLFVGLVFGLVFGFDEGINDGLIFTLTFYISFLFIYLRPFYLIPQYRSYIKSLRKPSESFKLFQNSPVHWDEAIAIRLPYLSDWLVELVKQDRKQGFKEIEYVLQKSPYQNKSAEKALFTIVANEITEYRSIKDLTKISDLSEYLPSMRFRFLQLERFLISEVKSLLKEISALAIDYENRETTIAKLEALKNLENKIDGLSIEVKSSTSGSIFNPSIENLRNTVALERSRLNKELSETAIPNPYIAGKPLDNSDKNRNVFTGRKDIIAAIEENIINPKERNSLLLYGRRRIGKTSTLKNLGGILSQYVTVYIDFQNAKWRDSDDAFCYNLIVDIYEAFIKNSLIEVAPDLKLSEFEKNTFTKFNKYLDLLEKEAKRLDRKILITFDEYERLEEDFDNSKISKEIFNLLRSIVQHREHIIVLFSGVHRFEEMKRVNWSDYLINVKNLELSFLKKTDAEKLLTEPVPNLKYEKGVKEKIIELTHCQPYLLQSFGFELVNFLNAKKRLTARHQDIEKIIDKVLVSASSYFFNIWSEEMSDEEQETMRILAKEGEKESDELPSEQALRKLIRKEVIEKTKKGKYKLTIELFKRYILKENPEKKGEN